MSEISNPKYDLASAKKDLRSAIARYKQSYEIAKANGDDDISETALSLALGANDRLVDLDIKKIMSSSWMCPLCYKVHEGIKDEKLYCDCQDKKEI